MKEENECVFMNAKAAKLHATGSQGSRTLFFRRASQSSDSHSISAAPAFGRAPQDKPGRPLACRRSRYRPLTHDTATLMAVPTTRQPRLAVLAFAALVLPAHSVMQPSDGPFGVLDVSAAAAVGAQSSKGSDECPHGCSGHGSCEGGVCKCAPGFTYYDCSLRVCPSDCSNNGFCYNATCHCHPGWRGADCSVRSCPDECNYHGMCKAGKCVCRSGWKGESCATRACPNECSNHGICTNYKCVCDAGYTGFDCATRACPADCSSHVRFTARTPPGSAAPSPPAPDCAVVTYQSCRSLAGDLLQRHVLLRTWLARHRLQHPDVRQRVLVPRHVRRRCVLVCSRVQRR